MKHKTNASAVSLLIMAVFIFFAGSCKKEENDLTTVTDIDGNVYDTVVIGTQTWMVQNLKTTRYNDGAFITTDLNDTEWELSGTGAFAEYENDAANDSIYGKLYNWHAVHTGKLAPAGWHVPTDAEWTTLITFLDGESMAGGLMKATSTLWHAPNTGATNSSGFTGLPAGLRYGRGTFDYVGYYGYFWSSTEYDTDYAWYRSLYYSYSSAGRNRLDKGSGFSVRCVRD